MNRRKYDFDIPSDFEKQKRILKELIPYLTDERRTKIEAALAKRTKHFTIAIEDVYQEHNAGALARTCDCFGIQNAHVIEKHHLYKISESISKGAEKWLDFKVYASDQGCLDSLRKQGYQIVATTPHENDLFLADFDIRKKSAIFFGTEKKGLSQTIIDNADVHLKIPMYGFSESYNISVSAAVILYDFTKRLHASEIDWQLSEEDYVCTYINWILKSIRSPHSLLKHFGK